MVKKPPRAVKVVEEIDVVDALNHFNAHREQSSKKAQAELAACFKNFDQFTPNSIVDKILSVNLADWQRTLRRHPGYHARDTLLTLIRLKRLLAQTVVEMHQHYDSFQEHERANERIDEAERERVSDLVLKELITFTSLGSALVATGRRHKSSRPEIAENIEELLQQFFKPQVSHFIKCLRNNHQHIRLHPTHWEITRGFGTQRKVTARFFLHTEELLQIGDQWDAEAQSFLEKHKKVDPHEVAAEYTRAAVTLVDEIEKLNTAIPSNAVRHLNEVEGKRDGWAARQMFKVMLQPFQNRTDHDPYSYLPKIFSKDEIRIIESFPMRSKAQIDQMILIKDKWRMCDDELREMFYRFFGVPRDS